MLSAQRGKLLCVRLGFGLPATSHEQCILTDLSSWPPGTYAGNPDYKVNGTFYTWSSDYDGVMATNVHITITDNGDGTGHADVLAYYP